MEHTELASLTSQKVLANDFKAQWEDLGSQFQLALERVGQQGWLILGAKVDAFEQALAAYWGLPYGVSCANGLDALEISLRCLKISDGQKVLTTPLSAFATSLAIIRAGGEPVFCDVDSSGLLHLDLARQILKANPDIRCMVPVHLFGHALDLTQLTALKEEFNLTIVEDCAQSIGAKSHGLPTGSVGQMAATSFYPTKNLGCLGDGGAILTHDSALAALAKQLRNYGETTKYKHELLGLNSRLDELQAAFLHEVLLPALPRFTQRRSKIAASYRAGIDNPALTCVPVPDGSESVWHLFPVLVSQAHTRSSFMNHLKAQNIDCGIHYPTLIPDQSALAGRVVVLSELTQAQKFSVCEVSLPIHPYLSDRDAGRVIAACNSWRP